MIKQNPDYWDCECEYYYIHKKTEETMCPVCGAIEEDQPDSIEDEIGKPINMFSNFRSTFGTIAREIICEKKHE